MAAACGWPLESLGFSAAVCICHDLMICPDLGRVSLSVTHTRNTLMLFSDSTLTRQYSQFGLYIKE